MFQSKTGWVAVAVSIVGALTAADVMPLLTAVLIDTVGESAARSIGIALTLLSAITAKLSAPNKTAETA